MQKDIDIKKVESKPIAPKEVTPQKPEKIMPKKKNKGVIITAFVLLFLFLFFIGSYFFIRQEIKTPLNSSDTKTKLIEFDKGESASNIARELQAAGIIKNKFYFLLYVFKTQSVSKLQAGKYAFSPSMSIPKIVDKMVKGEIARMEITIPEGFRNLQIQARINDTFKKKKDEIEINEFKVNDFSKEYSFLSDAPKNLSLEGYLFPDTYSFSDDKKMANDEIAKEVVTEMLKNFDGKLTPDLKKEIKIQKKTIFEIVTMASILEKEVKTKEDRKIVSGIFWDRIKSKIPLESCATIAYVLGQEKKQYSFQDTRVRSPYNTYLNQGLPEGPISNPGIESIKAAIYPTKTKYGYFLTDPKTGKTIFSSSLAEHNKNKVKYLK